MNETDVNSKILKQLDSISKQINGLRTASKPWLSVRELSEYLGVKSATIYQYVYQKQIPHKKMPGGRKLIFSRFEIDQWISSNQVDQIRHNAEKSSNQIWAKIIEKN